MILNGCRASSLAVSDVWRGGTAGRWARRAARPGTSHQPEGGGEGPGGRSPGLDGDAEGRGHVEVVAQQAAYLGQGVLVRPGVRPAARYRSSSRSAAAPISAGV